MWPNLLWPSYQVLYHQIENRQLTEQMKKLSDLEADKTKLINHLKAELSQLV